MFNVEQVIQQWRKQMQAGGIQAPDPLDELESHLRDEIEQQVKSGIGIQQAFEAATHKIGQAQNLKHEFKKIAGAKEAMKQKLMRVYFVIFPILYSTMCCYGLIQIEMSSLLRVLGLIAVALSALFVWNAPNAYKRLKKMDRKTSMIIQVVPLLIWVVSAGCFMNFILPHLDLTQGEVTVVFLWAMMPLPLISSIGYGLGDAARRQSATSGSSSETRTVTTH